MSDLRSSKQQLKDELLAMYKQITDPAERALAQLKKERIERIKEQKADYGL